ncbi:MAG: helix-turn-helix domain-containing protein [Candidatus Omnitrophota bacterium]
MVVKRPVHLTEEERIYLKHILNGGTEKARKLNKNRILLMADKGEKDKTIAEILNVAKNTGRNIRQRYADEGLEMALNESPRTGGPKKFTGKQEAKITALACSDAPEGYSRWSLRLLSDKAVELGVVEEISFNNVRNILKKNKLKPHLKNIGVLEQLIRNSSGEWNGFWTYMSENAIPEDQ